MDITKDFNEDFLDKYSPLDLENVDILILRALEDDEASSEGDWESSLTREKHDALNHTYHVSLNKVDDEDEIVEVSFYTGIDVGCELVDYSLGGCSLAHKPLTQSVMYDLKLDLARLGEGVDLTLAQYKLNQHKDEIMGIYSKQSYDNYVTGGGTTSTDKHYKGKFERFTNMGLYWECLYREEEFDRNFV